MHERYLQFREDGSDKVWFAKVDGMKLTTQWGRRGSKLSEKVASFTSKDEALAAFEKAIAQKLKKGYGDAEGGTAANVVEKRTAFHFKLVPSAKGEDIFGGAPQGIAESDWPVCKECEEPLDHVMTLRAHDERLRLTKNAALAVFFCNGDDGCESWAPGSGANAAVLIPKLAKAPPAEGLATMKARAMKYTAKVEKAKTEDDEEQVPFANKVGGFPTWIQWAEIPNCATCNKPMRFVAQLEYILDERLNFGDCGCAYVFVCDDEHEARALWQCS